jgi:hypothetical protein
LKEQASDNIYLYNQGWNKGKWEGIKEEKEKEENKQRYEERDRK